MSKKILKFITPLLVLFFTSSAMATEDFEPFQIAVADASKTPKDFSLDSSSEPANTGNSPKQNSSAVGFAQGCATGLAVGTFIFPAVGSVTGCIVVGSAHFFYNKLSRK